MDGYEERVLALEEENLKLKEQIKKVNNTLHDFYEAMSEVLSQMQKVAEQNHTLFIKAEWMEAFSHNAKYEMYAPEIQGDDLFYPVFRSNEETLRLITEDGKSLARFGDGEFSIASNISRQKFQRLDERLAKRIWDVVSSNHPNLLIAIANNYGDLSRYNDFSAYAIRIYMTEEVRKQHQKIIPRDRVYSDAYMTRPYVMYRDIFTDAPQKRFDALKRIWAGKKILIVEGAQTRLGVGNDLFSGASSLERILAPATSSFDRYDDILKECLRNAGRPDLFLLAIGPSSGVLAHDLTLEGIQAVDVGHVDLEYEWFLAGAGMRVPVPHKYNNEVQGGEMVEPLQDPAYESSIIASFA